MALTLYYAPRTRAVRPRWLLEEMGLAYTLERLDFDAGNLGGEAYKAIHPLQRTPVLKDGAATVYESTAILEYLTAKYGPTTLSAQPSDSDFADYLQWLHFGEAGLGPAMEHLVAHVLILPEDKRDPSAAAGAEKELLKGVAFFADALGEKDYVLARGFSAADISVGYILFVLKIIRKLDKTPTNVQAYWERLIARPAWRAATTD